MFEINIIDLIPKRVRQKTVDTTIDFVISLGKDRLSSNTKRRIKKLRSDGSFQIAFEDGLQMAANRFIEEYIDEDEDLVAAIIADKTFFQDKAVEEALLAVIKKPGAFYRDEQEIIVTSFTNVLPERRNRDRVDKAVFFFLKCLAEEVWNLSELRPIYELQFHRLTAEAIQEQVAIQKAQLQSSFELSSDIRTALMQLTDAIATRKLLTEPVSLKKTLMEPKIAHNLPQPDYERFIGRKTELNQIRQLLLPNPKSRHFVITIDGIGGIGKSTIALEVADSYRRHIDQLPEEEQFRSIIWITAKQTLLKVDGMIARPQSLRTLEDIYSTIAITMQREDIIRVEFPRKSGHEI